MALTYGLLGMREGGIRRLLVSPQLAYYEKRRMHQLPADAILDYQVECVQVNDESQREVARNDGAIVRSPVLKGEPSSSGDDA